MVEIWLCGRVDPLPYNPNTLKCLGEKAFKNIGGKGKLLLTSIFSPFLHFFKLSKTNFDIGVTFILSNAIAFSSVQSRILSLGKELNTKPVRHICRNC